MSISYKLRRAKWAAKGLRESGISDFRLIGLGFVKQFDSYNGYITFRAWAVPSKPLNGDPLFVIESDEGRVYQKPLQWWFDSEACAYSKLDSSHKFGLKGFFHYESAIELNAFLEFPSGKTVYRLNLGTLPPTTSEKGTKPIVCDPWEHGQIGNTTIGFYQQSESQSCTNTATAVAPDANITVLVPVYNGYEYLDRLFMGIDKTCVPFKCIIVEDCSPDERIRPKLREIQKSISCPCEIIYNSKNLGFVKSVNRGLKKCSGHVVLVNTDTELPKNWLERLIAPIFNDEQVASSTPFTNSGTICSFPTFLENNDIPYGLDVDSVDSFFKSTKPLYTETPTGVGFCMAMSKSAIDAIGYLDEITFEKGYGEENDWCQRAIKAGFKNVIVENLFVYHKHGGSFDSEEKQRLLDHNLAKLEKIHPNYLSEVSRFCENDPLKEIRSYIFARISVSQIKKPISVIVTHLLGGGADAFCKKLESQILASGSAIARLTYCINDERYHAEFLTEPNEVAFQCYADDVAALFATLDQCSHIYINELATYPHFDSIIDEAISASTRLDAEVTTYLHDYLPVCPNLNLLTLKGDYCHVPASLAKCQACFRAQGLHRTALPESIAKYRSQWSKLLNHSKKVICFSRASQELLLQAYPQLTNTVVEPHQTNHLPVVNTGNFRHEDIRIGILGNLTQHKGSGILRRLLEVCDSGTFAPEKELSFIQLGKNSDNLASQHFHSYEEYIRCDLPAIVAQQEIDMFVLLSIWPETFSFTCSEIIDMNIPAACFDLGAPAERIGDYKKGVLLPYPKSASSLSDEEAVEILKRIYNHAIYWRDHEI